MSDVLNIDNTTKINEIIGYDIKGNPIKVITDDINVLYDKNGKAVKKRCTGECNELKSLIEFHVNKGGLFGKQTECKTCRSTERRELNYLAKTEGEKYCNGCETNHPVDEFDKDRRNSNGLQTYCRKYQKINNAKWKSTFNGFLTNLFKDLRENAKNRDIKVEITKDDIIKLYHQQDEKCALTGKQLTINVKTEENDVSTLWNLSVDRIDSNNDYTKDNIQLVGKIINKMKMEYSQDDFINTCKLVDSYNK